MLMQARLLKVICLCVIVFDCWRLCATFMCVFFPNYRRSYLSFSRVDGVSQRCTHSDWSSCCTSSKTTWICSFGEGSSSCMKLCQHLTSNGQWIQNINTNAPRWSNGSQRSLESPRLSSYQPWIQSLTQWFCSRVPLSVCLTAFPLPKKNKPLWWVHAPQSFIWE